MVHHKIYFKGSSSFIKSFTCEKAYYRHHHVNRQTNKKFSKECLLAFTWKKILLIALESPELCSTLAAIKELVNRRHKELITMENFEKG
jgi:hypothetical protein